MIKLFKRRFLYGRSGLFQSGVKVVSRDLGALEAIFNVSGDDGVESSLPAEAFQVCTRK